jgi:nucleoside-diphosphate-sugar epimerase
MAKFLVTGGAGFIGSNISKELVRSGHEVAILDNLATGKMENIVEIIKKIKFIGGDLRDLPTARKACEGADYILHLGALPSVQRSVEDPAKSTEVNVMGTINILIAAKDAKVKRLVYAASSSAYGDTPVLPKIEDMKENPLSPYATSKLAGEHYCKVFTQIYGIETVSLRYFNVFGPQQDPTSHYSAVIPRFITSMLKGESPVIYGDGAQSRDFTFVENVIHANILAATTTNKEAVGKMMNIACGEATSLNDMIEILNGFLGASIKAKYQEARLGDVKHSLADISRAKRLIGFAPKVAFKEGLKKTLDWYRNNLKE